LSQTHRNFTLYLLDDGSTDRTAEAVLAILPEARVLRGKGRWWWAGALQAGLDELRKQAPSRSEVVLFINDDTEIDPEFLARGLASLSNHPNGLVLARAFDKRDGRLVDQGVHVDWAKFTFAQSSAAEGVNCLSTRGLFLRLGDVDAIGGFRPTLLPHYLSDYEFTIRAARRGFRLVVDPGLSLRVDTETTGYHHASGRGRWEVARKLFSRRSASNPIYWTNFILLSCPWRWKIVNLLRVWRGALSQVL
jgi:GT2 family glycosyltransferase